VLQTRIGTGEALALTWMADLATLFRNQSFAGVVTQVPSSPFIDDSNDRGLYFVTALVVPFTYNFSG
jgi:hypothetical protein